MHRRRFSIAAAGQALAASHGGSLAAVARRPAASATHPAVSAAAVSPGISRRALEFPADFGAHPETRIEWWYITGTLNAEAPDTRE